ncbi:hypothetical protein R3P38DRAFT_3206826 [Favolaschia claudopus]|uniref:K Homology domain-containing protein n=1 Tax=Favolaschia claudopus TaxID=2862362 RepID=A0AAW0AKN2_9AGAR
MTESGTTLTAKSALRVGYFKMMASGVYASLKLQKCKQVPDCDRLPSLPCDVWGTLCRSSNWTTLVWNFPARTTPTIEVYSQELAPLDYDVFGDIISYFIVDVEEVTFLGNASSTTAPKAEESPTKIVNNGTPARLKFTGFFFVDQASNAASSEPNPKKRKLDNRSNEQELQRVHDRLDRLEFGDTAASTPRGHAWRFSWDGARWGSEPSTPAPTPAIIAVGHTTIPLAETLPTAQDSPSRYSCTLVVPDSVVGHIVGRGGKGLHQSHDISGAQLRAYTDKASPLERRVSIRGTDQQIGEALIALGKRFMRPSHLSGDPAPPPPGPVPVLPNASGEGARPLKKRAHPIHPSQPPAPVPPPPAASAQPL